MQHVGGTGWQLAAFGCGAMCLGVVLALGLGLAAMVASLQRRQQQLLSTVSVVLLATGTLMFALAMA